MINKTLTLVMGLSVGVITGCVTRSPIATLPVVSMTDSIPAKAKVKAMEQPIQAKFCMGEPPAVPEGDQIGWIDEVTHRAQKKSGARYIKNAKYIMESKVFGSTCVHLTGEGWK